MNSKSYKIFSILAISVLMIVSLWQYTNNQSLTSELTAVKSDFDDASAINTSKLSEVEDLTKLYDELVLKYEQLEKDSIILDRMEVIRLEDTLEMIVVWNRDSKKDGIKDKSDLQFDVIVRDFYTGFSWIKTYDDIGVGNNHWMSKPVVIEGYIYYIIFDTFYGYELETGKELFALEGVSTLYYEPIIDEEGNFYFSSNFVVYKVDSEGKLVWKLMDDSFDFIGTLEFDEEAILMTTTKGTFTINFDGTFSKR